MAVRHNEIIAAVARHAPVLPMRLGIFFASRSSLIAKLAPYEANTAEFLRRLEDRQEWAVKIYVDENRTEKAMPADPTYVRLSSLTSIDGPAPGAARNICTPKRHRSMRRRQVQATVGQALGTVEARLQGITDSWYRLRPLPSPSPTGRRRWHGMGPSCSPDPRRMYFTRRVSNSEPNWPPLA